jgi:hypothetical protein
MLRAVEDRAWMDRARQTGPAHVHADYSWTRVVDRLCAVLFSEP